MGLLRSFWGLVRLEGRVSELEEEMELLRDRVRRSRSRHALQEARARAQEERELQEAAELMALQQDAPEAAATPETNPTGLRMLEVMRRRRSR
jgi:hypothetical protein